MQGSSVPDEYSCEEQSHKQDSEEDETRDITGKEVVRFPAATVHDSSGPLLEQIAVGPAHHFTFRICFVIVMRSGADRGGSVGLLFIQVIGQFPDQQVSQLLWLLDFNVRSPRLWIKRSTERIRASRSACRARRSRSGWLLSTSFDIDDAALISRVRSALCSTEIPHHRCIG